MITEIAIDSASTRKYSLIRSFIIFILLPYVLLAQSPDPNSTSSFSWSSIGCGTNDAVTTVAVSGAMVYAGGSFTSIDGVTAKGIAQWDGVHWTEVGGGMDGSGGSVNAIAIDGNNVYVGGSFSGMGGVTKTGCIAMWDGAQWHSIADTVNDAVQNIFIKNSRIIIAGYFTEINGQQANHIAQWDNGVWGTFAYGLSDNTVALAAIGNNIYAGGYFQDADLVEGTQYLAKWNGSSWSSIGGADDYVLSMTSSGTDLYVGGYFSSIGGIDAQHIARWNGTSWSAVGSGLDFGVLSMTVYNNIIYAAGMDNNVSKWNGVSWESISGIPYDPLIGGNVNSVVLAPAMGKVIVGGSFNAVTGLSDYSGGLATFIDADVSMPVLLEELAVLKTSLGVEIRWRTATETNNHGFEVERRELNHQFIGPLDQSAGGQMGQWKALSFVGGNGNSTVPHEYSFTDRSLSSGTYAYRLKQIDRDGKFEYSKIVEATVGAVPKEFALEQNYPNPFNPTTAIGYQLSTNGLTTLKIYDAVGREVALLVNEVKEAGAYSAQFDGTRLSSGIYFVRLSASGKTQIRKMMLMK